MATTKEKPKQSDVERARTREANQLARLFDAQCKMHKIDLPMELVFVLVGLFNYTLSQSDVPR